MMSVSVLLWPMSTCERKATRRARFQRSAGDTVGKRAQFSSSRISSQLLPALVAFCLRLTREEDEAKEEETT